MTAQNGSHGELMTRLVYSLRGTLALQLENSLTRPAIPKLLFYSTGKPCVADTPAPAVRRTTEVQGTLLLCSKP